MSWSFAYAVAMRYLSLGRSRAAAIHRITLVPIILLMACHALYYALEHAHTPLMSELRADYGRLVFLVRLALIVVSVLVGVFVSIIQRSTIFTTISMYGLFLGSSALVIVLSVMSGFEADLKHKILGTKAHIEITRPDQPLTDYGALATRLAKVPGVKGVTPFIANEVMISSSSNLSGVLLKGIDPGTVGQVTDLQKNLSVGELDNLEHPEKLRTLGGPQILMPDSEPGEPETPGRDRAAVSGVARSDGRLEGELRSGSGQPQSPPEPTPDDDPKPLHFKAADSHGTLKADPETPLPTRRVLPGVIIGRELAKNLRVYIGDDVNIVSPLGGIGPEGPVPKSKPFRVAGIFYSGMFEYDTKYAYVSIPAGQRFFGEEGEVTGLELKVVDPDHPGPVVARLHDVLGPTYEIEDWQGLNRSLFSALKLEKVAMFIVLCFIILVAAFSIIANGIMLVMEKGREIAILKSMGARDSAILAVFVLLGLYMGGLGTVGGIGVGVIACLALRRFGLSLDPDVYYITQLPVRMNPTEIVLVLVAALAIALAATMYPAWLAARLPPVEGLRDARK
jgi:lipoprotein-releasing system permease protein